MTDLAPNDLSHLSDEEFNALCPQGEHALGPEPLSPAAQAVLDALYMDELNGPEQLMARAHAAAALRAAAEQTRRKRIISNYGPIAGEDYCLISDLDAIATELESQ